MLQRASNSVHGGQHTSKTITSTKCSPVYVWGRVSRLHEYRPTQGYCGVRTLDFGQFEYRRIKKKKSENRCHWHTDDVHAHVAVCRIETFRFWQNTLLRPVESLQRENLCNNRCDCHADDLHTHVTVCLLDKLNGYETPILLKLITALLHAVK